MTITSVVLALNIVTGGWHSHRAPSHAVCATRVEVAAADLDLRTAPPVVVIQNEQLTPAIELASELYSADRPPLWTVVRGGPCKVEVRCAFDPNLGPLRTMLLLLDGEPVDERFLDSATLTELGPGSAVVIYRFTLKPAPGKHHLQARFKQANLWTRISSPLYFESHRPLRPEIVSAFDGNDAAVPVAKNGIPRIQGPTMYLVLANVTAGDRMLIYLDGRVLDEAKPTGDGFWQVPVQNRVPLGVYAVTARAAGGVGEPAGPPSRSVLIQYANEDGFLLRPGAPVSASMPVVRPTRIKVADPAEAVIAVEEEPLIAVPQVMPLNSREHLRPAPRSLPSENSLTPTGPAPPLPSEDAIPNPVADERSILKEKNDTQPAQADPPTESPQQQSPERPAIVPGPESPPPDPSLGLLPVKRFRDPSAFMFVRTRRASKSETLPSPAPNSADNAKQIAEDAQATAINDRLSWAAAARASDAAARARRGADALAARSVNVPAYDEEVLQRSFYFASAAHIPLRDFGPSGEVLDRAGAVIYEDMEFTFDENGRYYIRFTTGIPSVPTVLNLQFIVESRPGGPRFTITPPPIEYPTRGSGKQDRQEMNLTGRSEILKRHFAEVVHVQRTGTARFGFGRDALSGSDSLNGR